MTPHRLIPLVLSALVLAAIAGCGSNATSDDSQAPGEGSGSHSGDGDASTGGNTGDGDSGGLSGDGDGDSGGLSGDGDGDSGGLSGDGDSGGAGGAGGSGDGGAAGDIPQCPGNRNNPWGLTACSDDTPCEQATCRQYGFGPSDCANRTVSPTFECTTDDGCDPGEICLDTTTDPCQTELGKACSPACTADSCGEGNRCRADGRCEAVPCNEGFVCRDGFVCATESSDGEIDRNGCTQAQCGSEGYQCPAGWRCDSQPINSGCVIDDCFDDSVCPPNWICNAERNGCTRKTCESDLECDCGACFGGECIDQKPFCYAF